MICIQCGSNQHNPFLHNAYIDQDDYQFINIFPIKFRKIKNVKCGRCIVCGCIFIDRHDLHDKIRDKVKGEFKWQI